VGIAGIPGRLGLFARALLTAWLAFTVAPANAQGLTSVVEARGQVLPAVGPGVTALKRDASGRYYVLGKPATEIVIYDSHGNAVDKIPNSNSQGTTISYAVDFDLSGDGLVFVADRGANTVEIFKQDGTLAARVPVTAPTSVVGLSDGQFAVTSLTSKRLVQVRNERGAILRSFGDPADSGEGASTDKPFFDFGRISGDSNGDIFFAFTSLPNPTVRRYDQFGYVGYETSLSADSLQSAPTRGQDRVVVRLNLSHVSLSEQTQGSISFGSSRKVDFTGGVGTGLLNGMRPGGAGFHGAPMQQAALGSGLTGGPNFMGGPMGGSVSGEISSDGTQFRLGLGRLPSFRGGGRGERGGQAAGVSGSAFANNGSANGLGPDGSQTAALQFQGAGNSAGVDFTQDDLTQGLSFNGSGDNSLLANGSNSSPSIAGDVGTLGYNQNFGLPSDFLVGSLWNDVALRPRGFGDGGFPGRPPDGEPGRMGGGSGFRPDGDHFGPRGHFGGDVQVSASLQVNLGDLGGNPAERPSITAVAVDPQTKDVWAGVGDMLVHFDSAGNPIEIYHLTIKGGATLKPTAVLVEPGRLLVAANPWGIFEFARPGAP
jgi:hypothetical protein